MSACIREKKHTYLFSTQRWKSSASSNKPWKSEEKIHSRVMWPLIAFLLLEKWWLFSKCSPKNCIRMLSLCGCMHTYTFPPGKKQHWFVTLDSCRDCVYSHSLYRQHKFTPKEILFRKKKKKRKRKTFPLLVSPYLVKWGQLFPPQLQVWNLQLRVLGTPGTRA